jgi:hypothetical protein
MEIITGESVQGNIFPTMCVDEPGLISLDFPGCSSLNYTVSTVGYGMLGSNITLHNQVEMKPSSTLKDWSLRDLGFLLKTTSG